MPTVKFIKEKKTIEVAEGANLKEEAIKAGVNISSKILIRKGQENVKPPGGWERFRLTAGPVSLLTRLSHEAELRLAARTNVYGDIEVETHPAINWHGEKFWG